MTDKINLNADLGESLGAWRMGDDASLLRIVQSASLACGFHAGDPVTMRRTVRAALDAGVSIGAHPSYPDLLGFGRRSMRCSAEEVEALVLYQIGALDGFAKAEGARVTHVKPHGALSNDSSRDLALAETIARAIEAYDRNLILLAPACSRLAEAGAAAGLRVAIEIFADRTYEDDGALTPRSEPGAALHDAAACRAHVAAMLDAKGLVARGGKILPTPIHSICVHGDGPGAVEIADTLKNFLKEQYVLAPIPTLFA
ncbi:5-oxoprolinase subunit PxpA [Rhodoblastus acidophilus]|uniref:5-oxoprolinase subunit A n=1 Tax=Candidatus Rhodoblastus alkanivorans TaxID=2954117 RepID=A0ABS9Z883_9HYPH|nr:5-oxoprolinase subunit PxpA [Candidatus Rhodoblastus alkanivorans]MCI4677963.1 5-oxoprolinase subunit PxpA [Candidatus Rhodoblastus alkanivorans]MCI4683858.1 5-oxoprolinase subunit PxpA [Candidatus Rhodoblastus alkanivorans]MDI4641176.1 5-oxoprolinase subunit PxpA [Rhodoblastus acidophilus]